MDHKIFYFVLGVLAAHRISLLFSKESGPFRLFQKIRKLPPPKSNARDGLQCLWCLSVYSAAIVTGYYYYLDLVNIFTAPIWWLSLSSGAIIVNQQWTKG